MKKNQEKSKLIAQIEVRLSGSVAFGLERNIFLTSIRLCMFLYIYEYLFLLDLYDNNYVITTQETHTL